MTPDLNEWLESYQVTNKRPLRVLHIGNLANNAFKNSVALRSHGIECDVMCNDYYHAMGCPEWEWADFASEGLDLSVPDWEKFDLGGYNRPDWFAQGFYGTCLDYLIARNEKKTSHELWDKLKREQRSGGLEIDHVPIESPLDGFSTEMIAQRLAAQYAQLGLEGRLDADQFFATYQSVLVDKKRWDTLFSYYDVVIGYAISGLYPLISANIPYIAYEHGTIRTAPFDGTFAGRLCGLVYRAANNVLITNCDNVVSAKRLGLTEYRFVPHAILENWRDSGDESKMTRRELSGSGNYDFLIFHPTRQHWSGAKDPNWEKGNDILIRGFARFVKTVRPKARLIMVEWGATLAESKRLADELGVTENVMWVKPMSVRRLVVYVAATDALADQFLIGAWGAVMPIGMMLGKPTLIYVNEELHKWCFPEMPPVLNCQTEDSVFRLLGDIGNPSRADAVGRASREWYDKYHSMEVVAERLCEAIKSAIGKHEELGKKSYGLEPQVQWLAKKFNSQDAAILVLQRDIHQLQEKLQHLESSVGVRLLYFVSRAVRVGKRMYSKAKLILSR